MEFEEVLNDIEKLVEIELNSIRPGANIIITKVDRERGSLTLRTAAGQNRSRPLDEIKKIWDQMMITPAVHVEGVLYGSGTSRNQPETILANLPYIEWLKIDNKKHIAFVGQYTHAYGTLKQMGPVKAVEVIAKMESMVNTLPFKTAIVAKDVTQSISSMKDVLQGTVNTIDKGIYQLKTPTDIIIFLSSDVCGLTEGTYCVVESQVRPNLVNRLEICGKYYSVLDQGDIKMLIES